LVANAVEGEPTSAKDRALCRLAPQLVLDGAVAAGVAVGARHAVVAVGSRSAGERRALERAVAERPPRERVRLEVAAVPDGFVAGEETALLQALAGRPPKPTLKPPYPFEHGLDGRPTLVQNVETLAHVALIARFGAAWFRGAGAPDAPGTALVTLGGVARRPGVHEIETGRTLAETVERLGGLREPASAFLVGGYFGRWVDAREAHALRLTPETLGAGAIVAFPARGCAVAECARVLRYLASQSAGQCGPCTFGLPAIAGAAEELARGGRTGERRLAELLRWSGQVRGRGACRHPDGAARFAESSVAVFADEFEAHVRRGRCGRPHLEVLPG
jgi:NADH:ubiquinone oxidoreductase subunit F (NADH-binding)